MFGLRETSAGYRVRLPFLHRASNANLSIIVGLTAAMIAKPTTFLLLQYLPLAAHVLPQT